MWINMCTHRIVIKDNFRLFFFLHELMLSSPTEIKAKMIGKRYGISGRKKTSFFWVGRIRKEVTFKENNNLYPEMVTLLWTKGI